MNITITTKERNRLAAAVDAGTDILFREDWTTVAEAKALLELPIEDSTLPDIVEVLDEIGRLGADSPTDWATVAMGCLDQAMLPIHVQDQIEAMIRRAGIYVEKVES